MAMDAVRSLRAQQDATTSSRILLQSAHGSFSRTASGRSALPALLLVMFDWRGLWRRPSYPTYRHRVIVEHFVSLG